jgi:hypothetical protein
MGHAKTPYSSSQDTAPIPALTGIPAFSLNTRTQYSVQSVSEPDSLQVLALYWEPR